MSNPHESNGDARQDRAIQEVRSNPAAYFNFTTQQGSRSSTGVDLIRLCCTRGATRSMKICRKIFQEFLKINTWVSHGLYSRVGEVTPTPYPDPDAFDSSDSFAEEVQSQAVEDAARPDFAWAIGGTVPGEVTTELEYGIEVTRGSNAIEVTDSLVGTIEDLDSYRAGARIVARSVVYGAWRYVTPEEIVNA